MAFTLGHAPDRLNVILIAGSDFASSLKRKDGVAWPVVEISLDFGSTEWPATVVDDVASWDVDQDDVDLLIAARPRGVKLWYVEGERRLLWAQGDVDVRRSS